MSFLGGIVRGLTGATQSIAGDAFQLLSAGVLAVVYLASLPSWPNDANVNANARYDFIIVGAGSAGAVLANRLSENTRWKILLIEAGGNPPLLSVVPAGTVLMTKTDSDWQYYSSNDRYTAASQKTPGQLYLTRGKMLGGSSSINYMFYTRGNKKDFDSWCKDFGNGWCYDDVLPYFKKSEGMKVDSLFKNPRTAPYHNASGPLTVSMAKWDDNIEAKFDVLIDSFDKIGIKKIIDYNAESQFGISRSYYTHSEPPVARRSSTAQSFLVPAAQRKNLDVLKYAYVTKVIIENKVAKGVEVLVGKARKIFYADKEVIVSAGAYNSPKVLIASGIGKKEDLDVLGIRQIVDLPVGYGMYDHSASPVIIAGSGSLETNIGTRVPVVNVNSVPVPCLAGFFSTDGSDVPDIQLLPIYFGVASPVLSIACALFFCYNDDVCENLSSINKNREIFFIFLLHLHPKSRGRVKVTSLDPTKQPEIYTNFFSDYRDVNTVRKGFRKTMEILQTDYFKKAKAEVVDIGFTGCESYEYLSDKFIECTMLSGVNTIYHPTSTTAMGQVVDANMKVYGVERLRVIDGGSMPNITSGNTNVPIIMMAEKMSDHIKRNWN